MIVTVPSVADGIRQRHGQRCPGGRRCGCPFEAAVYSPRDGRKIRRTFPTLAAARSWRSDAATAVRRGGMRAAPTTTVREAADTLVAGMRSGLVRTRSGDPYKPSVTRGCDAALRLRLLPALGGLRLADVQRRDVQRLADEMLAAGADASTIRNALMPLRVVFRRALEDGDVTVNPVAGVRLPAVRGQRERIAPPEDAAKLLSALAESDRPLWATAFYAGLRRGELRALDWNDVDLAKGVIRVERSWDDEVGAIAPKSAAGRRTVPIPAVLRDHLDEHRLRCRWRDGLVFGTLATQPFTPSAVRRRAETAWKRVNRAAREQDPKAPQLEPIALHECRHTFASFMIAAGVNPKALTTYLGHSSIQITFDRYGHLFPGNEDEAAALLDAYLERANTQARLAALGS